MAEKFETPAIGTPEFDAMARAQMDHKAILNSPGALDHYRKLLGREDGWSRNQIGGGLMDGLLIWR